MASKAQELIERQRHIKENVEQMEASIGKLPKFTVTRNNTTYLAAVLLDDGTMDIESLRLTRKESVRMATWILGMHANHEDPPQAEKEEVKP